MQLKLEIDMIRYAFLLHLLFFCFFSYAQNVKFNYNFTNYDSVAVFKLDTSGRIPCLTTKYEVVYQNNISECFVFYKRLHNDSVRNILKIINNEESYGGPYISCSTKNLGIVFYKNKKIISYISFDTECNTIKFSHVIPAFEKYKLSAGAEGYYIYSSLSRVGIVKIRNFFINNGVKYPISSLPD